MTPTNKRDETLFQHVRRLVGHNEWLRGVRDICCELEYLRSAVKKYEERIKEYESRTIRST